MAITNLKGYKWQANDTINALGAQLNATFNINFKCDNINYSKFIFINTIDDVIDYELHYDDTKIYSYFFDGWTDTKYKIVEFIDGDDVTNSSLIDWLQENGTLTKEETNKLKLGSENVKMCLGDTEVSKIYLGTELIY